MGAVNTHFVGEWHLGRNRDVIKAFRETTC